MHRAGFDRQSDRTIIHPVASEAGNGLGERRMLGEIIVIESRDAFRSFVDGDD
jgi:hypothetical protein